MIRFVLLCAAVLWALPASTAWAGYYSVIHDQTNTNETTGVAIVVAAPATDTGKITVTRIRLTSSKSTSLDFRFRTAREQLSLGDTKSMAGWSCALPGCSDIYSLDGVGSTELYDMGDLQLTLDAGHRLFMFSDVSIASAFFTL